MCMLFCTNGNLHLFLESVPRNSMEAGYPLKMVSCSHTKTKAVHSLRIFSNYLIGEQKCFVRLYKKSQAALTKRTSSAYFQSLSINFYLQISTFNFKVS